jgi:hypothetical protein
MTARQRTVAVLDKVASRVTLKNIASLIGVLIVIGGALTFAVNQAMASVDNRITENTKNIESIAKQTSDNTELILTVQNELRAELLRIHIADMVDRDMGKGQRREYIMHYYAELMKICEDCPSTTYEVKRYLASIGEEL